jgi:HEAT repeat protein
MRERLLARLSPLAVAGTLVMGLGLGPGPAQAQVTSPGALNPQEDRTQERVRELRRKLLEEGDSAGVNAAFDLFMTGKLPGVDLGPEGSHDAFLADVLQNRDRYKVEARRCILAALRSPGAGRFRVEAACRLTQEALDDPATNPPIAQQAVATFPAIDDERGTVYQWIKTQLAVDLRRFGPGTPKHRQALGLIEALERMSNPIESVGVLITVLEQPRLPRAMENRLREGLQRMTAQTFDSTKAWRDWYETAKNRSLAEWRLDVARRRDERLRRYESEAEKYFGKLLAAREGDALFRELQAALNDADVVMAVRRLAIRELGTLGKRGDERAIALLRARLNQPGTVDYDEVKELVIRELGDARPQTESGIREVLDEVKLYLAAGYHVRMRMAAASALGALKVPAGVEPLLNVLSNPASAGDDLLEVVVESLGRMGVNPEGRVSSALMDLVATLRSGTNGGAAGTHSLLAIVARALGQLSYVPLGGANPGRVAEEAARVARVLADLATYDDVNVRYFATTSLGYIPDASSFPALVGCLQRESSSHVRKAILDAIGQRAIDDTTLVADAIAVLVPYLDNADPALARVVRQRLEELATKPPTFRDSFVGLELVTDALKKAGKGPAAAVPFLTGDAGLPPPEALTPAQRSHEARYYALLAWRAQGRLTTTPPEPEAAYADFEAVIRGQNWTAPATPQARAVHVGRAKAVLRLAQPRPKEALKDAATVLTNATPGEDVAEVWSVALDAANQLKQSETAASLATLLQPLQPHLPGAPTDVQKRIAELSGAPR